MEVVTTTLVAHLTVPSAVKYICTCLHTAAHASQVLIDSRFVLLQNTFYNIRYTGAYT